MARNYKKEYESYHSKPKQKKRRAQRNKARRAMKASGRVNKGDGKDVDHKNKNTAQGGKNLRIRSKSSNRSDNRGKGGRPKKKGNK